MYPPSDETTQMTFNTESGEMKQSNPLRVFYLYPEKQVQRDKPLGSFFFNGSFVFPTSSSNTDSALQFLDCEIYKYLLASFILKHVNFPSYFARNDFTQSGFTLL
jgi:hypothetical protein